MRRHRQTPQMFLAAAFLATMSIGGAGCGGDDEAESSRGVKGKEIGVVLPGKQIPYYVDLAAGMMAEAKERGIKVDVEYADQDVSTEIDQVQNLVTQKPDALVIAPIDQAALVPVYRQASEADIPIVTVSDNIGKEGRAYQLAFIGQEYTQAGAKRARWLVRELGGKGSVVPIHAIRGGNYTETNWEGAQRVFGNESGITVFDGPYVGDFTPQVGLKGAQDVLTRHPDVDALYVDNDDLAYGAIQAVRDRGRDQNSILILGNDGGEPAIAAVKKGELDYTLSVCGYAQGGAAVETLANYLENGTKPPPYVKTLQLEFTPKTVASVLASRRGKAKCSRAY